jgi:thiopeptide-type bacteriocin biosynthesis protein
MTASHTPWLSLHVFLSDVPQTERFLDEQLAPLVRRWRDDGALAHWFFIRYWEGGPHVRVRLSGDIAGQAAQVQALLREAAHRYLVADPVSREVYYRAHQFDGVKKDPATLPWHEQGSVELIDYEPEIQRYGGEAALAASERLFCESSDIALGAVRSTLGDMPRRLSLSFGLMAASILATRVSVEAMASFFRNYAAFWAGHSTLNATLAGRLNGNHPVPPGQVETLQRLVRQANRAEQARDMHTAWMDGVAGLVDELAALRARGELVSPFTGQPVKDEQAYGFAVQNILSSHIHMLNNRLGIVPTAEMVLAAALHRAASAASRVPSTGAYAA